MLKKISLFLFISINFLSYPQNIPLIVQSQKYIFNTIAKDINSYMPNNVEILVYKIQLLNGEAKLEDDINNKFIEILSSLQGKYKFNITSEKEIIEKYKNNKEIDLSFLDKHDEVEYTAFGKMLNIDAIIISSVTIMDKKTKKIWDSSNMKFIEKQIALFQGTAFNTDTNAVIYRFSYYFYF